MGFAVYVCYQNDSEQLCCMLLFSLYSASIAMLLKIVTEHCDVKEYKKEEKPYVQNI